jgi:purine-binding chemotaxis protein CheW
MTIDWVAAKARLLEINHSLDELTQASPARAREVMAARARLLGRSPPAMDLTPRVDLVTFAAGGERFALETRFVRATLKLPKVSTVPFGPPALLGLCAFRGLLLSVWDPSELLTGAPAADTSGWLLVLGEGRPELGLAVQDVAFVAQTRRADVAPLPESLSVASRAHLFGGLISEESIRVLSGEAILAEPRLTWS